MSGPKTVTVALPQLENYAEDIARADRMMQAAELAGMLTPQEFGQWMEHGAALMGQRHKEGLNAVAGKHEA